LLDSSTISLCLSLFRWAKFRRTKGAVKLHLLVDHDGYLRQYAMAKNPNEVGPAIEAASSGVR
jgi:hypothetical protein